MFFYVEKYHNILMGDVMEYIKYGIIAIIGITVLFILGFSIVSTKPLKTLLINALLGIAALAAVDIISKFTGIYIHINQWSVGTSGILGIPGVLGLVVLKLLI